jgi:hypothetical protein
MKLRRTECGHGAIMFWIALIAAMIFLVHTIVCLLLADGPG